MKNLKDAENMRLQTSFFPNLVRTGTLGGGSCFFHALMTSMSSGYRKSKKDRKISIVKQTRTKIAEKLDIATWKELGDSFIAQTPTFMNIRKYFEQIYRYLQKPDKITGVDKNIKNILKKIIFIHYIFK